jgi:hypothetical protein
VKQALKNGTAGGVAECIELSILVSIHLR